MKSIITSLAANIIAVILALSMIIAAINVIIISSTAATPV
jgi:hypothetical protein